MLKISSAIHSIALSLLLLLTLTAVTAYYVKIINVEKNVIYSDYADFYQSLRFSQQDKSLYSKIYYKVYDDNTHFKIKPLSPNLNPPFFSALIYPMGYFNFVNSFYVWTLFSVICGIISILIIQKNFGIPYHVNLTLCLILTFFIFTPTIGNFLYGQVSLLLLLFLTIGWHYLRNQQQRKAAIMLAGCAAIKPFLGLFILYFLCKRQWRALVYFSVSGAILTLLPLLFFGKQSYIDYMHLLPAIKWYASTWNVSLLGFFTRIFGGVGEKMTPLIYLPYLTKFCYWLSSLVLVGYLAHFLQKQYSIDPVKKIDLDFSLILMIALLVSPLGWRYYFVWWIIPIVVLHQYAKYTKFPMLFILLICTIIFLIGIPSLNANSRTDNNFWWSYWISDVYFCGALLLIFTLCFITPRIKQSAATDLPSNSLVILLYGTMLLGPLLNSFACKYIYLPAYFLPGYLQNS